MDVELAYIIIVPLDSFLWMLGGKYHKGLRRYGVPLVHLTALVLAKAPLAPALIHALLLGAALSLGYGESKSWWQRSLVALAFFYAFGILGFTWWMVIMPVAFMTMFYLSNWKPTARIFSWKIVEGLMGALMGVTLCQLLP